MTKRQKSGGKPKLSLDGSWNRWVGFSYLFDNPGTSLKLDAITGLQHVYCNVSADQHLEPYKAFNDAVVETGLASKKNAYSFYPLPTGSYHVTVWDGINDDNLSQLTEPWRERFIDFMSGLPLSAKCTPTDLKISPDAFKATIENKPIRFKFKTLKIWGNVVLVAQLAPVDDISTSLLEEISKKRIHLDEIFAPIGRPRSNRYSPHVSLGYFAEVKGALKASENLSEWKRSFRQRTANAKVTFQSVSAFAFTSMIEFIKLEF